MKGAGIWLLASQIDRICINRFCIDIRALLPKNGYLCAVIVAVCSIVSNIGIMREFIGSHHGGIICIFICLHGCPGYPVKRPLDLNAEHADPVQDPCANKLEPDLNRVPGRDI